jgi:hypothetical protein
LKNPSSTKRRTAISTTGVRVNRSVRTAEPADVVLVLGNQHARVESVDLLVQRPAHEDEGADRVHPPEP